MVFPVVLLLIMLVVQGMLWWWARTVALTAARDGASVARSYQSGPKDGAHRSDEILAQYAAGLKTTPSVETQLPQTKAVRVTVHVQAQSLLPLPGGGWITSSVTSPKEAWLP
ncbi:pilus assembly protein [Streptacidiphilus sp. 4-A2]|nr:pilus assembly protein [Streptacidiphilus sp. 4-A2]